MPYVFHPFHLAEQMPDEVTTCVALLHDVVEHTDVTFEDLEGEFPEEVIDALRLLTHGEGDDYFLYVRNLKENPVARTVKLADLAHNSDLSRYDGCLGITEDMKRAWIERYSEARRILESDEDF